MRDSSVGYFLLLVLLLASLHKSLCYSLTTDPYVIPGIYVEDNPKNQDRVRFDNLTSQSLERLGTADVINYVLELESVTLNFYVELVDTITFSDREKVQFRLRITSTLTSLSKPAPDYAISFDTDYALVATVLDPTWFIVTRDAANSEFRLVLHYSTDIIGVSYLRAWVRELRQRPTDGLKPIATGVFGVALGDDTAAYQACLLDPNSEGRADLGWKLLVQREEGAVQIAFQVIIIAFVVLLTFALGCELNFRTIKEILKKPVNPAIGFFTQYIVMPVISFLFGYYLPILRELGFGILVTGCCPGGGASNVWCLLLDGDINLSVTMTFLSTTVAFGMLPLLLFIFGRFFIDPSAVEVPYGQIVGTLCGILFPAVGGIVLCWKRPKWALKFSKATRPLAIAFLIFIFSFGIYANWSVFRLIGIYWISIPIGAFLPWLAFAISCLIAFVLRRDRRTILTVGIETSIQNTGIAIVLLLYSMPKPDGSIGAIMPIIISVFTPLPFYIMFIVKLARNKCRLSGPTIQTEDATAATMKYKGEIEFR